MNAAQRKAQLLAQGYSDGDAGLVAHRELRADFEANGRTIVSRFCFNQDGTPWKLHLPARKLSAPTLELATTR